mgnify:CR=1 FL=1
MSRMTKTFLIPEGPGATTSGGLTARVKPQLLRKIDRFLQEADRAMANGQRDVATSKLRFLAQELDGILLSTSNDVIGGTIK